MADQPLYPADKFIEPEQLAELLRGADASQVQVVDVRGDDFAGGHVKGAVNIPSTVFADPTAADEAIDKHLSTTASTIVVHCAQSKQRGPKCAAALASRLEERTKNGADVALPNVLVLKGGFDAFAQRFSAEASLVADFDANLRKDKH